MVALGLVGIGVGEGDERAIEDIALAQIAVEGDDIAGARMGPGERPATQLGIGHETRRGQFGDIDRTLHVAELAHIVVFYPHASPSQKDVAGRLHHLLPTNDPLAVIGMDALASLPVGFYHRGVRLFYLEEERITLILADEQHDIAARAHTAYADNLAGEINQGVAAQQVTPIFAERGQIAARRVPVYGRP